MNNALLICKLNPVSGKTYTCSLEPGKYLSDYFDLPDNIYTEINGIRVQDSLIHPGDFISMTVAPMGDTDTRKDLARTGIVLAVQIAAAVATGGMSAWAQAGITAAASIGASIGVNALIPPSTGALSIGDSQGGQFTRLGALTGSRNQISPYGTVPRVYGKRKIYPPMSARPFTEIVGNEQYLRLLMVLGAGPLTLTEPKIGDTIIGSFDANNNFTSNDAYTNVEIDVAEQPELYSSQVDQQDPGAALEADNDSAIRTTAVGAEEISIDITFPQGLFAVDSNTHTDQHSVDFTIEQRLVGETAWTEVEYDGDSRRGSSTFNWGITRRTWRAISGKRETLRVGHSWKVPPGQYEIRLTRVSARTQEADAQLFDLAEWTALRTIIHEEPTNMPGVVQLAMRVKATDQIAGVLDDFSVVAESRLAIYDGTSWDEPVFNPDTGSGSGGALTSNPAWIMADILTGSQNARAIGKTRLNGASFKSFADASAADNRFCNIVFDSPRTVLQSAGIVGSTCRGSLSISDGQYAVIQDDEKTIPVQHFTPRNSSNFSSTRTFPETPHAIRVNFVNPDADWQLDEAVVYDDGYSLNGESSEPGTVPATRFETLDLEGVTSWEHAWREGRFRLAEARLRPERYVLEADIENLVCERGDMVLATHDITLWGLKSGRIKGISGSTLTLDEQVTMEAGKNYNVRIRNSSGGSAVASVETNPGTTSVLTLSEALSVTPGDLFMFGEQDTETQELKVFSIEPRSDLSARLTLIDAAPEIYDADSGPIPPFNSNITKPPVDTDLRPPLPKITGLRADSSLYYNAGDRSPIIRLLVDFELGAGNRTQYIDAELQVNETDGYFGGVTVDASQGTAAFRDVEDGLTYRTRIRARNGDLKSDWVYSDLITVQVDAIPSDVAGFDATFDRSQFRLKWDANPEPNIKEYEVRRNGTTWGDANPVAFTDSTSFTEDIQVLEDTTYRVKAVNTAGKYSLNAAVDTVTKSEIIEVRPFPPELFPSLTDDPSLSLGRTQTDLDGTYTQVQAQLTARLRAGFDYFIINRASNKLVPFTVTTSRGPGSTTVDIESQVIQAPAGSTIVLVPGQNTTTESAIDEQMRILREDKLPELQNKLGTLNGTILPGLQAMITQLDTNQQILNGQKLPELYSQLGSLAGNLNNLNTTVLPGLDGELSTMEGQLSQLAIQSAQRELRLGEAESELANLNTVALPALSGRLDDAEGELDNLDTVVLPGLNSELSDLNGVLANPTNRDDFVTSLAAYQIFTDALVANAIFTNALTANQIFTDALVANTAFIGDLVASSAFIDTLSADTFFANEFVANSGIVGLLVADDLFTTNLAADSAFINTLSANQIFTDALVANEIFTDALVANTVFTNELSTNVAFIQVLTANTLFANELVANALFTSVLAADDIFGNNITGNQIFTDALAAKQIFTDALVANTIFTDALSANTAFIDELSAQTALIANIFANNIDITGKLTNADDDFVLGPDGLHIYGSTTAMGAATIGRALGFGGLPSDPDVTIWYDIFALGSEVLRIEGSKRIDVDMLATFTGGLGATLPTSAPTASNRFWNDNGTVKIT